MQRYPSQASEPQIMDALTSSTVRLTSSLRWRMASVSTSFSGQNRLVRCCMCVWRGGSVWEWEWVYDSSEKKFNIQDGGFLVEWQQEHWRREGWFLVVPIHSIRLQSRWGGGGEVRERQEWREEERRRNREEREKREESKGRGEGEKKG